MKDPKLHIKEVFHDLNEYSRVLVCLQPCRLLSLPVTSLYCESKEKCWVVRVSKSFQAKAMPTRVVIKNAILYKLQNMQKKDVISKKNFMKIWKIYRKKQVDVLICAQTRSAQTLLVLLFYIILHSFIFWRFCLKVFTTTLWRNSIFSPKQDRHDLKLMVQMNGSKFDYSFWFHCLKLCVSQTEFQPHAADHFA